ncbi:MAG TPA: lysylphosphatidylglycerol synthase transmembrane domain-containing protein [Abditibacteriaceae bacterium]
MISDLTASALRNRVIAAAVFWAKVVVALLLVTWLVNSGRLDRQQFRDVNFGASFVAAIVFQLLLLAGQCLRWWILVRAGDVPLRFQQAALMSIAGQFAAVFTPAGLGLDGVRLLRASQLFPARRGALVAASLWDRFFGLVSLLVLCVPSLWWLLQIRFPQFAAAFLWALSPLVGIVFLASRASRNWTRLEPLRNSVVLLKSRPRHLALAIVLSFLLHGCNAAAAYCGFLMLNKDAPLGLFFAAPLVVLSSLIPLTPLGIGVVDGAAAELFLVAGASGGAAVTMLLRATNVLMSLPCGLALLWPISRETENESNS